MEQPRVGHHAGVGREHAFDVGVDLAQLGAERRRQRDRRRVRAPAAERRDVGRLGHALEARDDRDLAFRQRFTDPVRAHVDDLRAPVVRRRYDPRLRPGERDRVVSELLDRDGKQRHRDALAGGQKHVHLAPGRRRRDARGKLDQVVGGVPHRADDDEDVLDGLVGLDHAARDVLDAVGVADRRSAELLDDQAHEKS